MLFTKTILVQQCSISKYIHMPTSKGASNQTNPKMHFATVYTSLQPEETAAGFFSFSWQRNHLGFQKHMQGRRTKTLTTFLLRWWHENWMISAIIHSSKWNVFNYRCLNLGNKAENKIYIYIYIVFLLKQKFRISRPSKVLLCCWIVLT